MDADLDDESLYLLEAQAEAAAVSETLDIRLRASPQQRAAKRARPEISDLPRVSVAFQIPHAPVIAPIEAQIAPEEHDQVQLQDDDQERTDEIDRQFHQLPTNWEIRCKAQHERTCLQRPGLFLSDLCREAIPSADTVCGLCCTSRALVRCMDCSFPAIQYFCGACDVARHPYAHFHRRQSFAEGFWSPLPPLLSFAESGERYERGEPYHALHEVAVSILIL